MYPRLTDMKYNNHEYSLLNFEGSESRREGSEFSLIIGFDKGIYTNDLKYFLKCIAYSASW